MKTIVTGGAGFLGSHLCDLLLEKGHKVICIDKMAYHRYHGLDTRIVRIFNTYGPRMRLNGDGSQTRSFCYVSDEVEGIYRLMMSDYMLPVNIGNPEEHTIIEFTGSSRDHRLALRNLVR